MKSTDVCQRFERDIWGVPRVEGFAAISAKLSGAIEIDGSHLFAAFA